MEKDKIKKIISLYKCGFTLENIGNRYCVTREWIRQVLKKEGISKTDGGAYFRRQILGDTYINRKKDIARIIREKRIQRNYLCSANEYDIIMNNEPIRHNKNCLAKKYYFQKRNSGYRGIEFKLSFPQWYKIWLDSGYLDKMGRGKYVMGRYKDSGAYELGNVEIITASQNSKDARKYKTWSPPRFTKEEINQHLKKYRKIYYLKNREYLLKKRSENYFKRKLLTNIA